MPHDVAFHKGLHCLLRQKRSSGTEIHNFTEFLTGNSLKYKMDNSIPIVSLCMGKGSTLYVANEAILGHRVAI